MAVLPDVTRCTVLAQLGSGQVCSNTFHLHKSGGGIASLTELAALAADLDTWFTTTYRAMLLGADTLLSYSVAQVEDPTAPAPYLESVLIKNLAGTTGGTRNCPESVCGVISLHTPVAKKYARGHLFTISCDDGGNLINGRKFSHAGSYYTRCVNLAAKFAAGTGPSPSWTGSELSGWTLCIFSKQQDKVTHGAITDCSSAVFKDDVRWLRSRERGTT